MMAKTKEKRMMPGTEDGQYFPFARRHDVLLGIKIQSVAPGYQYGAKGTTYFSLRLRSAPENGLFADLDAKTKVVKLSAKPANLWDAWPGVDWEKKDNKRASTTVGVFMPGEFKGGGPESQKMLLDAIGDKQLATKLADYLVQLIGAESMIVTKDEMRDWINQQFEPLLQKILDFLSREKAVKTAIMDSVGNVGMQAALLKKVYDANGGPPDEVKTEEGDPAEDEHPEGHDDEI